MLYNANNIEAEFKFKRILHTYIESGMPVAIGIDINQKYKHSIICIGHGKIEPRSLKRRIYINTDSDDEYACTYFLDSSDMVSEYIVQDDNKRPYTKLLWEDDNLVEISSGKEEGGEKHNDCYKMKPEYLLIPLYKRMYLEASDAYDIVIPILSDKQIGLRRFCNDLGVRNNPVLIRLFMATSKGIKNWRVDRFKENNVELKERFINTPFSHFVWVCELFEASDYPHSCCGEIIIDATAGASAKADSVILINYKEYVFVHMPDEQGNTNDLKFDKMGSWDKYESYGGNLYSK